MARRQHTKEQVQQMAMKTLQAFEAGDQSAEEVVVYVSVLTGLPQSAVIEQLRFYANQSSANEATTVWLEAFEQMG